MDLLAWCYVVDELPPRAVKAWESVKALPEVKLCSLRQKELGAELKLVLEIRDDAWRDNWGHVSLAPDEVKQAANSLKIVLRDELAVLSEIDGKPAGMCIAVPNLNEAIADLKGKLLPLGWAELLWLRCEVIVVDNDAEGTTVERARAARPGADEVRWLVEPVQNIALARNRALEAARGTWVAFVDDDEVSDEHWLAAYWAWAERDAADGFFGPVLPVREATPKTWLDPEDFYSRGRYASGTPLAATDLTTSNALLRRSPFGDRRFDPACGRPRAAPTRSTGRRAPGPAPSEGPIAPYAACRGYG